MSNPLKIRPECFLCANLVGTDVENVMCKAHQNPTCYRIKSKCLQQSLVDINGAALLIAYVDGYFDHDLCSYSAYFKCKNDIWNRADCVDRKKYPSYAVGEMYAAYLVCLEAIKRKYKKIRIFHHLSSTALLAKGIWKPKKPETQRYLALISKCMSDIQIEFILVNSNDGFGEEILLNLQNTYKDARQALFKYKNPRLNSSLSKEVNDTASNCIEKNAANPECVNAINAFYEKKQHTFDDYVCLRTYGKDRYSEYSGEQLRAYATENEMIPEYMQSYLGNTKEYENAVRWILRGLQPYDAIKKAKADSFIAVPFTENTGSYT